MLSNNTTCEHCGKPFHVRPSRLLNGRGKFCSQSCAASARTGPANPHWGGGLVRRSCRQCGREFYKVRAAVAVGEGIYCSRACKGAAQREMVGTASTSWKGGKDINVNGYVRIQIPGGARVFEHRYVMEQHIGRSLRSDEHVHHINGSKTDNRLDNLVILSPQEHRKMHPRPRLAQWARDHKACVQCGTTSVRHWAHGLCRVCYRQERLKG